MQAFVILKRSFRYEVKSKYLFKRKKCSMYKEVVLYNSILSLSYGKPRSNVILQKKKDSPNVLSLPKTVSSGSLGAIRSSWSKLEKKQTKRELQCQNSSAVLRGISYVSVTHLSRSKTCYVVSNGSPSKCYYFQPLLSGQYRKSNCHVLVIVCLLRSIVREQKFL